MLTLAAAALFSTSAQAGDLVIASSAQDVKPLAVGDRAPQFTVTRVDGSDYRFDPAALVKPTMLITFRGGWCPYCNTHLQELRHVVPELTAAGYDVLFLSADRPELLYSSLKEENRDLGYTILSDARMQASSALGIAFRNDAGTIARMKEYGIDLEQASGETHHALPVPAVFVIDKTGVIRFTHFDPDYRKRLDADAVRAAARTIASDS
jgi:peroxiredoxin